MYIDFEIYCLSSAKFVRMLRLRAFITTSKISIPLYPWIPYPYTHSNNCFIPFEQLQQPPAMNNQDGDAAPSCARQQSTTKKRRRFTLQEKMCLVRSIRRKIEADQVSICKACDFVNVHMKQYLAWSKEFNAMKDAKNIKAKSLCAGRSSILKPIQEQLLRFIFELREQGMGVSISMVVLKAMFLSREFREKTRNAQYHSVRRFIRCHGLVYRMATHVSQKDPRETATESLDFMRGIRPKLTQPCRHQDFIINMDQTPIPFTYNSKKTLEIVGMRTIHVRQSTNDTKRATFAMTVTVSGKVLKPLMVFKGKPGARIEKRDVQVFVNLLMSE